MRNFILLLILLNSASIFSQPFGGGDGTESSPYEIYTKAHLEELADSVNAGNSYKDFFFEQKQDITEPVTKMIGFFRGRTPHERLCFSGSYNGNLYKINLALEHYVEGADTNIVIPTALFPYIVGATITQLIVDGSIITNGGPVSGIVGLADSSVISQSVNYADIKGYGNAAGIVGILHNNNTVSYCLNLGKIETKENWYVGGIVGFAGEPSYSPNIYYSTISNSKNAGCLNYGSGIVGTIRLGTSGVKRNVVINCINTGVIGKQKGQTTGIAIIE